MEAEKGFPEKCHYRSSSVNNQKMMHRAGKEAYRDSTLSGEKHETLIRHPGYQKGTSSKQERRKKGTRFLENVKTNG
jgi:hypothetical protein